MESNVRNCFLGIRNLFLLFLFFVSCSDGVVYYEYEGVFLTRIEKKDSIHFYWGRYNDLLNNDPLIRVSKEEILVAFAKFNKDKTITICPLSSGFEKNGESTDICIESNYGQFFLSNVLDSVIDHQKRHNMFFLTSDHQIERRKNEGSSTKVRFHY